MWRWEETMSKLLAFNPYRALLDKVESLSPSPFVTLYRLVQVKGINMFFPGYNVMFSDNSYLAKG